MCWHEYGYRLVNETGIAFFDRLSVVPFPPTRMQWGAFGGDLAYAV
jgi:hypothetical protein